MGVEYPDEKFASLDRLQGFFAAVIKMNRKAINGPVCFKKRGKPILAVKETVNFEGFTVEEILNNGLVGNLSLLISLSKQKLFRLNFIKQE